MGKIRSKAGTKRDRKLKAAGPAGRPKAAKVVREKAAVVRRHVDALGADEALIIRKKKGDFVAIGKVRTRLGVSKIREVVAARRRHAEPSGRGELTEDEKKTLDAGGFDRTPLPPEVDDPVAVAAAEYAKLRNESLSAVEAADLLNVNDSRVRQRLTGKAPTLYGFKVDGDWRVPKFQFVENRRVPGLERVIPQLRAGLNPVTVVRWFNAPNPDLPADEEEDRFLSPLEWLKTGRDPSVVAGLVADL